MGIVILGALLATGGFFGWRWMQKPTTFPITHVVVEGEFNHVPQAALEAAIHSKLSGGFFSINLGDIRHAVLLQPWIAEVSFRRVWPNTLMVQLSEQKPLARFGTDGVLTSEGKLFYRLNVDNVTPDYVIIFCRSQYFLNVLMIVVKNSK